MSLRTLVILLALAVLSIPQLMWLSFAISKNFVSAQDYNSDQYDSNDYNTAAVTIDDDGNNLTNNGISNEEIYNVSSSATMSTKTIKHKMKTSKHQQSSSSSSYAEDILPFTTLILEGGGTKAISYIGALLAFKELGYYRDGRYKFETIGGTSAGCLMGFLISLDIKPTKLEELIYKVDILQNTINFDTSLLDTMSDSSSTTTTTKLQNYDEDDHQTITIFNTWKFRSPFSWFRAFTKTFDLITWARDFIELWLKKDSPGLSDEEMFLRFINDVILPLSPHRKYIQNLTKLTFDELKELTDHDLHCFATQINDQILYEFSAKQTPNDEVLRAVYASMSLPGIFKPLSDGCDNTLVDGGLLYNFPITMNDRGGLIDQQTLGLSLNKKILINQSLVFKNRKKAIDNFNDHYTFSDISTLDYIEAIYSVLINRESFIYASDRINDDRIIYLESPIKTVDLHIENSLKSLAISKAYLNTLSFMNKRLNQYKHHHQQHHHQQQQTNDDTKTA